MRAVRGLKLLPASKLGDPKKVARLWLHEMSRVFFDRLSANED